jgi:hypothetical protein
VLPQFLFSNTHFLFVGKDVKMRIGLAYSEPIIIPTKKEQKKNQ